MAKGGTTIYPDPEIFRAAKHKALDLNIKSDSAMVNEALREWTLPKKDLHSAKKNVISGKSRQMQVSESEYLIIEKLVGVLRSDDKVAKRAVETNLDWFNEYRSRSNTSPGPDDSAE